MHTMLALGTLLWLLRPQGAYRPLNVGGMGGQGGVGGNFSLEPPLVHIGQMREP